MTEIINYKCPILNKDYRVYNTSTSVIADVLIKLEDCIPHDPIEIICPKHEPGPDCLVKISDYNDKRKQIIKKYEKGNVEYNEIKMRLIKEINESESINRRLNEEVERLKQQELKDIDIKKSTLCILVEGFKELK